MISTLYRLSMFIIIKIFYQAGYHVQLRPIETTNELRYQGIY